MYKHPLIEALAALQAVIEHQDRMIRDLHEQLEKLRQSKEPDEFVGNTLVQEPVE